MTVSDGNQQDGYTEYYVLSGEHSLVEADASWLTADQIPSSGWTQFDEQTITDGVTYYLWTDGVACLDELPLEYDPAVYTAPTCTAPGTLVGVPLEGIYEWVRSGPATAAVLTATPEDGVFLTGTTTYGPYDLTQLSGEVCLSEQPPIEEDPPVTENLAETGFPLLGVLGLAGSFSLIGGGLLNAGRILRKRH